MRMYIFFFSKVVSDCLLCQSYVLSLTIISVCSEICFKLYSVLLGQSFSKLSSGCSSEWKNESPLKVFNIVPVIYSSYLLHLKVFADSMQLVSNCYNFGIIPVK